MVVGRQVFAAEEAVTDVRVLIDVSGSMKKTDPKNLRTPALEMIVGLLPDQSKAGVWTFAKYVNMLVPHKPVDKAWRKQAKKQTNKIHSNGLFTNIEQAINKATVNQTKSNKTYRQSVILLSDGLVDIEPDQKASVASRKRILSEIVPRLKQANVAVHTIALSDGADKALLREIALETDGWYEEVGNAEQLQRVFLHLFEKAAQRDTVPIAKGNQFKIDESVTEMTVLLFRKPDAKATQLLRPDQTTLDSTTALENVRWHNSDSGYDLITIAEPQLGEWKIDAEVDPDNRVMILTDLKLKTTDLPNNIVIGENFDFDVSLTNKDKLIERKSFLDLLEATIIHENEIMDSVEQDLNEHRRKGMYRVQVGDTFQAGRNDIVTTIVSNTFERQRRQSINVVEMPFKITTERLLDAETRTHRLLLEPDVSLVNDEKISIAALLTAEDGSEWSYDVLKADEQVWQLTLAELEPGKEYKINLQIKAETLKGRSLFLQPNELLITDELVEDEGTAPLDLEAQIEEELSDETSLDSALEDDELLGLEEDASLEEDNLLEPMEDSVVEEIDEELAPLIDDVDELSPLEQMELEDELSGELDELDGLLIDDGDELAGLDEAGLESDEGTTGEISTNTFLIGNAIFALIAAIGFFVWRRKSAASQNPGEQL